MTTRREYANAIRILSMDAVQKANSGHPGAPMGMADIAEVLWRDYIKHNPKNPSWQNRDRFILSNGHGSMLLYSLLHLSGYDISVEDLKNFRQLHAKTAGHPEYGYAPGIETTTGPLGQGVANAVGMALAEKMLASQFNRDNHEIIDHYTYVFMGDGCMMEGISHEVCSLAGTLKLGKLIAFYDDNGISIDGEVEGWFTDNTVQRFESYGWQVIPAVDGHSAEAIKAAIDQARHQTDRPTLICCKTTIGFGSPNKAGKESSHGSPLGEEEVVRARENLGWTHSEPFKIPELIYGGWNAQETGAALEAEWDERFSAYKTHYPELASEFERRMAGQLPANFEEKANQFIQRCQSERKNVASRKASLLTLNTLGPILPELVGGSADLAGSNLTFWEGCEGVLPNDAKGNYIFYGVREFGMSAIMNGISLYGGFIPYGATFLVFMDYARNAVRMASLMKQRAIFVYTHDSIGLGEDGPTHQPVEQLTNLRTTPGMNTWRPCDTIESATAWKAAILRHDGPSALIFSRQNLPAMERSETQIANISRGGYILKDCEGTPELIFIATGSEVDLAIKSADTLTQSGHKIRVVSMPSTEVFDSQDINYRLSVLPSEVTARIAIEAASGDFWYKYVGLNGRIIAMQTFGESAPATQLFKYFGFTEKNILATAGELLKAAD